MKQKILDLIGKLSKHGWRDVFLDLTNNQIDIEKNNWEELIDVFLSPIKELNRNHPGLVDYSPLGEQMITPYSFSQSLLYHSIANPMFIDERITYYLPSSEIELIENLVFASVFFPEKRNLNGLKEKYGDSLSIGIFSYQYNTVERSCHYSHADMNYSRTGISRIGVENSIYDSKNRTWSPSPDSKKLCVMPARFGTFLCLRLKANEANGFAIMDELRDDKDKEFIFPIHKIFEGEECLDGIEISLSYKSYHRNEKLKRVHDENLDNTIPITGFDKEKFPFIIDNENAPDFLYKHHESNSNYLVVPTSAPLTEPAVQNDKYIEFVVPAQTNNNRFNTSYNIPAKRIGYLAARQSPEYVNIRNISKQSEVINREDDIININDLNETEFIEKLRDGNFKVVDFIDRTCDGFITVESNIELPIFSSYSLITAPDYFPYVNQREVYKFEQQIDKFAQGGAIPLSDGRIKANINYDVFKNDLETLTAIVSNSSSTNQNNPERNNIFQASHLPDGASSIYHPGWDISMDIDLNTGKGFNAAYGLGSPFPEDAKLCAALNSYWPAAAPDASRTFFRSNTYQRFSKKPTAIPLTDYELGIHPKLASTLNIDSNIGWDGEHGPFFEIISGEEFVNYCDIARSDYTYSFWRGRAYLNSMDVLTSKDLINRMLALKSCINELPPFGDTVKENILWLVSFVVIDDWVNEQTIINANLIGSGFQFIFAEVDENSITVSNDDLKRLTARVTKKYICQMDSSNFYWEELNDNRIEGLASIIPKVNYFSLRDF